VYSSILDPRPHTGHRIDRTIQSFNTLDQGSNTINVLFPFIRNLISMIMVRSIVANGRSLRMVTTAWQQVFAQTRSGALATFASSSQSLPQKIKELREATNAPMMECKKALMSPDVNGDISRALEFLRKQGVAKASSKVAGREAREGLVGLSISNDGSKGCVIKISSETDFASRSREFANLLEEASEKIIDDELIVLDEANPSNYTELMKQSKIITNLVDDAILGIRENLSIEEVQYFESDGNSRLAGYVHGKSPHSHKAGSTAVIVELIGADDAATKNLEHTMEEAGKKLAMHIVATRPQYISKEDVPTDVIQKEKQILMEQLLDSKDSNKPENILNKIVEGRLGKYFSEVCLNEQPHVVEEKSPKVSSVLGKLGIQVKRYHLSSIR